MVTVVLFLAFLFWNSSDAAEKPAICGDYDNCIQCNNSNCNDQTRYLPNVCRRFTEWCICKPGKNGANCDNDCIGRSYGIACNKTCDCDIDVCDKRYGCTPKKDNNTSVKTIPTTPVTTTSKPPITIVESSSTVGYTTMESTTSNPVPSNTVIIIVVPSVIIIAVFVFIVMVKCGKRKIEKKLNHLKISTNSGAELLANGSLSEEPGQANTYIGTENILLTQQKRQINEYDQNSSIAVDLSDTHMASQVHPNEANQYNYIEIRQEDLAETEISLSPTNSLPKDTHEKNAFNFPILYSSCTKVDAQDGVYNALDFLYSSEDKSHRSTYAHISNNDQLYNELNFK